jgi:hypothetical protein
VEENLSDNEQRRPTKPKYPVGSSLALLVATLIFVLVFIVYGAIETLSPFVNDLFQVGTLALGLWGAFLFGKQSSEAEAWCRVRQQAKPARRNLLRIIEGLVGVGARIIEVRDLAQQLSSRRNGQCPVEHVEQGLRSIELLVEQQVAAAGNALEDWGDLAPEEAKEIRAAAALYATGGRRNLSPEEVSELRREADDGLVNQAGTN